MCYWMLFVCCCYYFSKCSITKLVILISSVLLLVFFYFYCLYYYCLYSYIIFFAQSWLCTNKRFFRIWFWLSSWSIKLLVRCSGCCDREASRLVGCVVRTHLQQHSISFPSPGWLTLLSLLLPFRRCMSTSCQLALGAGASTALHILISYFDYQPRMKTLSE